MTTTRDLSDDFMVLVRDQSQDPRPIYDRLRTREPVFWTPLGFWYITSYDLAKDLVRRPKTFSNDPRHSSGGAGETGDQGRTDVARFHQDPDSPAFKALRSMLLFPPLSRWKRVARTRAPGSFNPARGFCRGTPGSAGTVTGTARVLSDPYDADALEPRDIIVAHVTDPAGTPLFMLAGGVVMAEGGRPVTR
ncbi:hypothetical protein GCM10009790_35970 [Georgenia ruanii]|uniref:hypothetical protein n=1 Tax=Georgenia ruanii TaxID=348442 RepID=UPI0031DEF928